MASVQAKPDVNICAAGAYAQVAIFMGDTLSQSKLTSPQQLCVISQEAMEGLGRLFIEVGYDYIRLDKKHS